MSEFEQPGNVNPYGSPARATAIVSEADAPVLDYTIQVLRATRPWVRFISVLFWIGAVLCGLFVLAMVGAGLFAWGGLQDATPLLLAVVYAIMAGLYVLPGLFLWQFASRIVQFQSDRSINSLNSALEAQKAFWRFVGIAAAAIVFLYVLFIAGVLVMGISGFID